MKNRIALGNSVFNVKSCDYDMNDEDSDEFNDNSERDED